MKRNVIFESFHSYENIATQPFFDLSNSKLQLSSSDISYFYIALEQYYKWKLNVEPNSLDFNWELKNPTNGLDVKIDWNEFYNLFFKKIDISKPFNKENFNSNNNNDKKE